MVNRPSVPEIITVNSEALQTQIRDLLPSQNGFGSELQATNVITPIIDLTSAAEGSGLPILLQNALAFGSQTEFQAENSTVVLANSPGFYRVVGAASNRGTTGINNEAKFTMSDGLSTKTVWELATDNGTDSFMVSESFDLVFWLASGESLSAQSTNGRSIMSGSVRQIADSTGTLVNPSGYPL
jgi:hypothetical protein